MLDKDLEVMKTAAFNKADICNNHLGKYFIRAIMAAFFIVVATILSNVTTAVLYPTYPQFGKLLGAIFFSIAIILVVFIGGELFTGNNMVMAMGVYTKLSATPMELFVRGVMCNFLVCLAVYTGMKLKSESGK